LNKFVQQFKEKQQQAADDSDNNEGGDDDEIIINEGSDEEKDSAKDKADAALIEIFTNTIEPVKTALTTIQPDAVMSTLNMKEIKPLGLTRLRMIEFLAQLVKLNKTQINEAIEKNNMLAVLINMIEVHPWNNFLQLKTQQIFEDVLESELFTRQAKFNMIKECGVVPILIKMSENTKVSFVSSNQMRHGYMGFAIKLSNLIKKKGEAD